MLEVIAKGKTSKSHPHPLLFVHGAYQNGRFWDQHFLNFFADTGFRAVAVSLRGHGASPTDKALRWCSISDYVDDVASIVNTLAPHPVLVGHSMGGFVVQKYMERNDVPAAVLLASAPPRGHLRTVLRCFRLNPWGSTKFSFTGRPADLYGETIAGARQMLFGRSAPDCLVEATTTQLQPESTRALLIDMTMSSVKKRRTTAPVYVLGAEQDMLYTDRDVRATAAFYGTRPTIIPDIGHSLTVEPAWPLVAESIVLWLTQLSL